MLKGKTALVTGSTSGIGLATARALAHDGANIMLNGFGDKTAIEIIRTGIERDFGVKARYSAADMGKPAEIADMVRATEKEFGALDVLVNNAGIQHVANIEDFPIEKWDAIIAINLSSSFHTIRAAVPGHEETKMGPHHQYCVCARPRRQRAKSRLCLRQARPRRPHESGRDGDRQCRRDLQCHLPGWVLTPLVQQQIDTRAKASGKSVREEEIALLSEKQPMHQFTKPESIGALAVFLCSDAAATITGSAYSIDGGWVAQ